MKLVTCSVDAPLGPIDCLGSLEGEWIVGLNAAYKAKPVAEDEIDPEALAALFVPLIEEPLPIRVGLTGSLTRSFTLEACLFQPVVFAI
jgi:hypothetical protein